MLRKLDVKTIHENVFSLIGDKWLLITAGPAEKCNTMTASWGGLGVLWARNTATIYVRPQRYTYELLEQNQYFSLCFFSEEYREQLKLCGSVSGRDTNKIMECGFNVETGAEMTPYMGEAELVLICKKLYYSDLDPSHFSEKWMEEFYKNYDYHRMYIGEIVEAYGV